MDLTPDPLVERLGQSLRARLTGLRTADHVWAALRSVDAPAFEAPVECGGYDLGLTTGVTIATQLGQQALPDVYGGGALVLDAVAGGAHPTEAHPIAAHPIGAYPARVRLATELADGALPVALAGFDLVPLRGHRPRLVARRSGTGWLLYGRVVPGIAGPGTAGQGIAGPGIAGPAGAAWCVPFAADDEVLLALVPGDRMPASLAFGGVAVDDAEVVGRLSEVLPRARLRQAAYLLGLGQGAHELAIAHASGRSQFGRRLMEFQAVSFALAQASIALAGLRLLVGRGAWLADAGRALDREAVEALALAAETAMRVVRVAVQVHGARGLARDTPVHAFYLAVREAATRFGPPSVLWQEAGRLRLDGRVAPTGLTEPAAPVGATATPVGAVA